jgi:hypothetical protein
MALFCWRGILFRASQSKDVVDSASELASETNLSDKVAYISDKYLKPTFQNKILFHAPT